MIPASFEYTRASTVQDAIKKLSAAQGAAQPLAGGHSLIPAMKLRLNQPDLLVDISRIRELKFIRTVRQQLIIGAATTHQEIADSAMVRNSISMLADGAAHIGDPAVRNRGTLGGSLAHADPAADWPALLLAASAFIELEGPNGARQIHLSEFFQGFYTTALQENEIIRAVYIPVPTGYTSAYAKFEQPASRFAIVGCAVMGKVVNGKFADVRVAFTGVSDNYFRDTKVEQALKGKTANEDNISAAAAQAAEGVDILSDHFASETYRKHLAKVYCKRALMSLL